MWAGLHGIVMLHRSGMLTHGPDFKAMTYFLGLTMMKGAGAKTVPANRRGRNDDGRRHFGRALPQLARDPGQCRARRRRLAALGVGEDDSVALMLRNDFATFEANMAAGQLGAYAVPINWHFTPEEAGYILADCRAKALVIHADLLPQIASGIPADMKVLVVPTPPEIGDAYGVPAEAPRRPGRRDLGRLRCRAARPTPSRPSSRAAA